MKEKPFYFYHLVNKDANLQQGLISLQYMYDHKMYNLFDKYATKYFDRITNYWQIDKYKGKKELSREEYLDALKIYRGEHGANYIYFFKFAPYEELGPKMKSILEAKDIYQIDLNNPEVKQYIEDIFYGYQDSNSDNKLLDKNYYEKITKEEYFKNYQDNSHMNYALLNHIGISFKNGYIPLKCLKKVS